MTRFCKLMAVVVFLSVCLVPAASSSKSPASTIVDFSPTSFPAKADANFFYSIDNELKYSDKIDPHSPTLIRGPIRNFLVSPDGGKIAVVVRGKLLIVGADSVLADVAKVDSIYRSFKPIGRRFFRDEDFQWSHDSKSLYLIRDEYYRSSGSQLFSKHGELWMYDLESKNMHLVIKPFAAHSYFLGMGAGVYYSEPTSRGELQLKFFDGHTSTDVGSTNASDVLELLGSERPFYSFSILDYQKTLAPQSVRLVTSSGLESLLINDKKYLSVTQGKGWDGYYYCADLLRSVFLPGDRYFLLNVPFCANYNGQLLLELGSTRYQTLPANTVVFRTLNTSTYTRFRVTSEGIVIN